MKKNPDNYCGLLDLCAGGGTKTIPAIFDPSVQCQSLKKMNQIPSERCPGLRQPCRARLQLQPARRTRSSRTRGGRVLLRSTPSSKSSSHRFRNQGRLLHRVEFCLSTLHMSKQGGLVITLSWAQILPRRLRSHRSLCILTAIPIIGQIGVRGENSDGRFSGKLFYKKHEQVAFCNCTTDIGHVTMIIGSNCNRRRIKYTHDTCPMPCTVCESHFEKLQRCTKR